MDNSFNVEWARQTWKLLLYLEAAYQYLSNGELVVIPKNTVSWGANLDKEVEIPEATLGFEVNPPKVKGLRDNYLWIGLWLADEGLQGDRPIWIQDLRLDDEIWKELKQEFKEGLRMEDGDYRAVGLKWDFSDIATNEEVQIAGRTFAERITKLLLSKA